MLLRRLFMISDRGRRVISDLVYAERHNHRAGHAHIFMLLMKRNNAVVEVLHESPELFYIRNLGISVVYSQNSVLMYYVCHNPLNIFETTENWAIGIIPRGVVSSECEGVDHGRFVLFILYQTYHGVHFGI